MQIQEVKQLKKNLAFDPEALLELQSGHLETSFSDALARSLDDVLLIDKSVVDSINTSILDKNERRVAILEQIMCFRKGIRLLEWEHEGLRLKVCLWTDLMCSADCDMSVDRGRDRKNQRDPAAEDRERHAPTAVS